MHYHVGLYPVSQSSLTLLFYAIALQHPKRAVNLESEDIVVDDSTDFLPSSSSHEQVGCWSWWSLLFRVHFIYYTSIKAQNHPMSMIIIKLKKKKMNVPRHVLL